MLARTLVLLTTIFLFSSGRLSNFTIIVLARSSVGRPVAGATVTFVAPGGVTMKGVTGANGGVVFNATEAGNADITVTSDVYGEGHGTAVLVEGKRHVGVTVVLRHGAGKYHFNVIVANDRGEAISGANVIAVGPEHPSATTNGEGLAAFEVNHVGHYAITVLAENFPAATDSVTVASVDQTPSITVVLGTATKHIMTINVHVVDGQGNAVAGAKCSMRTFPSSTEYTDSQGEASFRLTSWEPKNASKYINITHDGFEAGNLTVEPIPGGIDTAYNTHIVLRRKAGKHFVIVGVYEQGSHQPLMDAHVSLVGDSDNQTQDTDGRGRTTISPKGVGSFRVTATHSGFSSANQKIFIASDQDGYNVTLLLVKDTSKGSWMRMLQVKVVTKGPNGALKPVKNAIVKTSLGFDLACDSSGHGGFIHEEAPGETINLTASASGYRQAGSSVIVGAHGTLTNSNDFWTKVYSEVAYEERQQKIRAGLGSEVDWRDRIIDQLKTTNTYEISSGLSSAWASALGPQGVDSATIVLEAESEKLHGDLILNKGKIAVGGTVNLDIALLYEHGKQSSMQVDDQVDLFAPNGKLITSSTKPRSLKADEYSRRYLNITAHEPGTYTIKAKASGTGVETWTDEVKFLVTGATKTPSSNATLWIRDPAVVSKTHVDVTDSSVSWTGAPGTGTVTFHGIPEKVHDGDMVTLTMDASGPAKGNIIGGWFNLNCAGKYSSQDNGAGNDPAWKSKGVYNRANLTFVFVGKDDAYIQVSAGHDPPGSWATITWKYHRAKSAVMVPGGDRGIAAQVWERPPSAQPRQTITASPRR